MTVLDETFQELANTLDNVNETQVEEIRQTISRYAIAAAAAGAVSGLAPGVAGLVAALTQTGLVWATYVKINKILGISMQEHTAKFLGSAIGTNIITSVGALLITYAAAAIVSFIPIIGNALAAAADAAVGYILIYACALIYLNFIVAVVKPDGTIEVKENEDTKQIIKDIIARTKMEDVIKEGRDSYKKAKKEGAIDEAIKHRTCPNCGKPVEANQKFCSNCGSALS